MNLLGVCVPFANGWYLYVRQCAGMMTVALGRVGDRAKTPAEHRKPSNGRGQRPVPPRLRPTLCLFLPTFGAVHVPIPTRHQYTFKNHVQIRNLR